ncbi:MAG: N-acetylmuramoyl-L-alanine amidase [Bacteroidetes Order II. Incertae sedis bacterium]|nr:N-acetylmuramoyl-L-alanine amidase [Bacteroidetes Order II. bacterium]
MKRKVVLILCLVWTACSGPKNEGSHAQIPQLPVQEVTKTSVQVANEAVKTSLASIMAMPTLAKRAATWKIDTLLVYEADRIIELKMNDGMGYVPFREEQVQRIYEAFEAVLKPIYPDFRVKITVLRLPLYELVPNLYRSKTPKDSSRMPQVVQRGSPIVQNKSKTYEPRKGLFNRNIALWHSHGWYYEHKLNRWEWQRARSFLTVEDLLPMQFVLPYLVPMLEKAGATVFLPRERDPNPNEIIIDNDGNWRNVSGGKSEYKEVGNWLRGDVGFAMGQPPYPEGVNPFQLGTYRMTTSTKEATARITWASDVPESGEYAVYVAYQSLPESIENARYTVDHTGGTTVFEVNQKIGSGTWIYLGTFHFDSLQKARITLTNQSDETGKIVTADAIRLGGGLGMMLRNGTVSGRAKYVEGARYWLQYAGMPDSLVYNVSPPKDDDYRDDFQSRGEWVNYLRGAPFGPNKNRTVKGLGIPIDLSLAFHTDAGLTTNANVIGTLMIYSSKTTGGSITFPDGQSRFANRDLADILQTQLTDDLRAHYDSSWTRRELWDKDYSEAFRPNVPAALLELLSHQNFQDQKFAQDPRFRFDVGRAIYKAMLRFIAGQHGFEPIIQPLPPSHFRVQLEGGDAVLSWQPVADPLEKTANPERYVVYMRKNDGGWDNGTGVTRTDFRFPKLEAGVVYAFKVAGVNEGGESFPTEVLSVGRLENSNPKILVMNGFDRVSPPHIFKEGNLSGFAHWVDEGVSDGVSYGFTGDQFNFETSSVWSDDDAPGHGASYADFEGKPIAGNTKDFTRVHGKALLAAGYSFDSVSDEAVMANMALLSPYKAIDLILGEEKETPWPKPNGTRPAIPPMFKAFPEQLQQGLETYLGQGGKLFASGSYLATDLVKGKPSLHPDITFAKNVLRMTWRTDHAATVGDVHSVEADFLPPNFRFRFETKRNPKIYAAEAPDGLEPASSAGKTLLRYSENNISAGIGEKERTVLLGFPFEVIADERAQKIVMKAVMQWLGL